MKGNAVDPSITRGIRKRREWIRRHPGAAGDYIRLDKVSRDKVDALFVADRKLRPNEVTSLVESLTERRLLRRRVGDVRKRALANMRANLSDATRYRDKTVVTNVKKMSPKQARMAAAASVDELIDLARIQNEGNPFWYH